MKKQTAAVMSAVTLISSVVPIAPVSAMENQEVLEEIVEQTTEQVEGAIASSEILKEGNEIILEEAEIVSEEIKEDAVSAELPEEITNDINIESNEGEKIEVEDEEVFAENNEELTSSEVTEDLIETENTEIEMTEGSTAENMQELPSNEVTEDVIEIDNTENEVTESATEENTEETIKVEQEIETTIQSGNVTENSQEGEKTHESIAEAQEIVEIPDAVLKAAINEVLGRYDDLAHPITKSELEEITYLYYNPGDEESDKITGLKGLEYAINLTELFCPNNQISDLSPLANLKKLNYLELGGNQISDFSPVDHISNVSASNQVIYLETQHINKGGQVIINNPILGKDFSEPFNITIPTGVYNEEKNQLVWDNVTTHHLQVTFQSLEDDSISGVIIVPVEFMDGDVEEEIIDIPDTGLRAVLNEQLGRANKPNHPITKGEIEQISELYLSNEVINLKGLEYATNLRYLRISSYEIRDLTPLINLTQLNELSLSSTGINDLNSLIGLTNLKSLTSLDLSWTGISDLGPLSNLTNLSSLDLSYNSIHDLEPLTNLKNLKTLDLSFNAELSDLDPLSNLTNLTGLYLHQKHGKISELASLSNLSNLKYLILIGTEVSDLTPLSNLTKLEELGLGAMGAGGNQISDINPLSNLTSLKVLSLDCNKVTDISPISKLTNLSYLSLIANQVKDLTPLDALQSLEYLRMDLQEITLDPVYIQRGETVVIDNPLVGQWWNMTNEYDGITIYDNEFNMEKGYYDAEKNQFIFEDVTTDTLSFSFSNYSATDFARQYQGNTDGMVTIPVRFYEISENFTDFATNDIFNIIGGTGKLDDPLVLQVVEGTDKETAQSLLAKYNDYGLSVTKETTDTEFEWYVLTFTKGEEKVIFKVQVPVTDTELISYLNSLINQPPAGGTTPPAGGTTPPAGGTTPPAGGTTPPAGGTTPPTGGTTPPTGGTTPPTGGTTPPAGGETTPPTTEGPSDSSQHPETGFSGLMGIMGLGALSLGAVFVKRKKK